MAKEDEPKTIQDALTQLRSDIGVHTSTRLDIAALVPRGGSDVPELVVLDEIFSANAELLIMVCRRCSGGCGNEIVYEIACDRALAAPSVRPLNSVASYRGGHLCIYCDGKARDALGGKK